jgi:hypothetical protein
VKNKRERLLPVRIPGVKKTSRLGSRDLVASGVMCRSHGSKNDFLVEPQNRDNVGAES